MCCIAVLKAGTSIPYEKVENCVYNNPHAFGLILKADNKLQVIKKCPQGGNDPKEIFKLLEKHKDVERYLHLRWRTEGPIDLDNTHPFTSYYTDARQVYFMHNGTLMDFRPKSTTVYEGGKSTVTNHEPTMSDSRKFNEEILSPLLEVTVGKNGTGDITNPMFQKVIEKFWGHSSRGLLVCNDLDLTFINFSGWKELDFGGGKFWSSNNDYWDKLTRGPVFDKQEEERKKKEEAARQANFQGSNNRSGGRTITDLKDIDLKPKQILTEDLSRIFEDFNIWKEEGLASLCNLTEMELSTLVARDPDSATGLLVHITSNYDELYRRKERMVKYIKEIKTSGKTTFDKTDEAELSAA